MTKWLITAVHDDGRTQVSEIEHDTDIASLALDLFEVRHGWGCWISISVRKLQRIGYD